MGHKKEYEEKQRHGTVELPLGLHKMEYPEGTDAIFYLHWHQEFEFFVVTKGSVLFMVDEREYMLRKGDGIFINSNQLHSAKTIDGHACAFFAVDFSYQILAEDIHSRFAQKYIRPVLNGETEFAVYLAGDGEQWQQEVIRISRCSSLSIRSYSRLTMVAPSAVSSTPAKPSFFSATRILSMPTPS